MELLTVPVGPLQCNCYVLWEDRGQAVVIDPGDEGPRLISILESKGIAPRLILNTHGHFDHVGGVSALRERFGATYKIHPADVPILEMVPARTKLWGITVPDIPKPREFVEGGQSFDIAGLKVDAIHTPGHTPGSVCFRVPSEGLALTGDTLFRGSIGRTDFPGGDTEQIFESIRGRLLTLPSETRILPGHGADSTIGVESETNPFLA